MSVRLLALSVALAALVLAGTAIGGAQASALAGCLAAAPGFSGAEQRAAADGVQADLRVDAPRLAAPASASGASVILTDRARTAFAQVGWLAGPAGAASSFVAWTLPRGAVALRTVPGVTVGSLVVYKVLVSGGELAFWFDGVDGSPSVAGVPSALVAREAQAEAVRVAGGRLTGTRSDPGVLGWISVRAGGVWSRFAPGSMRAASGLGIRRVPVLEGEAGSHLLVWDRGCAVGRLHPGPRVSARQLGAGELHETFGVDLRATAAAPRVSPARARAVARAATGSPQVLATSLASCTDAQLVPSLDRACYLVALDPGARSRPPIGPRGGPVPPPLRALSALVDASTGALIETLAS